MSQKKSNIPSPTKVRRILYTHGWRIRTRTSKTGSVYIYGTQGYKRVLVRFSDHKQPIRVKRNQRSVTFDFFPGSLETLERFKRFVVDPSSLSSID